MDGAEAYTHPTILKPVYHGLDLRVPPELGNQELAVLGYVDVTAAPFHADPSGTTDSTAALQQAVDFSRDHQMVCFFPAGRYLVSDTIRCAQGYYQWRKDKVAAARHHPCVMVGSSADSSRRAVIELAPHSPGFGDSSQRKHVVKFWARACRPRIKCDPSVLEVVPDLEQPNISFNQMFANIDIRIGEGNAGAIGIYLRAAQGSGIFNSTIDATNGHTGVEGAAGSGGSHFNVTIIGGRVGMDLSEAQSAPTIAGITLIGQTDAAIQYNGSQTLTAVGIDVRLSNPIVAFHSGAIRALNPFFGHMCIVDSTINYTDFNVTAPAIETCKMLHLDNVFIRNAATCVRAGEAILAKGRPNCWTNIRRLDWGPQSLRHPEDSSIEYTFPILRDGKTLPAEVLLTQDSPTEDLCSKHRVPPLPTFESTAVVNVKEYPYNAKGDGVSDDSNALQRAIDEHDVVFLLKGHYLVTRPIILRPETKLIGVHLIFSNILAEHPGEHFSNPDHPRAILLTPNVDSASNTLAFFSTSIPRRFLGARAFQHQSAGAIIFACRFAYHYQYDDEVNHARELPHTKDSSESADPALVLVTVCADGKWFMHYEEQPIIGPHYRHLLIDGTSNSLEFYQLNVEHAASDAQMEIRNSSNIRIFSFKTERNSTPMLIHNCSDIVLYGWGGNATAFPGKALIEVVNSLNVCLIGLIEAGRMNGKGYQFIFGKGDHPALWTILKVTQGSSSWECKPCERPVCAVIS